LFHFVFISPPSHLKTFVIYGDIALLFIFSPGLNFRYKTKIFRRVVIGRLDNYCWAIPKYSRFEPPDNRQGSTFLLKLGVKGLGVNGKVSKFFKYPG
jgi:hypothetical protein